MSFLRWLITGLGAAVLPDPERRPFERLVDAPRWSALVGAVELLGAGWLLMRDARRYYYGYGAGLVDTALAGADPLALDAPEARVAVHFSGLMIWFFWAVRPLVWLMFLYVVAGGLRIVAAAIHDESIGDPLVWAGLRLSQLLRGGVTRRQTAVRRGPRRPDRLLRESGVVVLLTRDDQPGWNPLVTIEVDGRFFRLLGVEERPDGPWAVLAYRLREEGPHEAIRSLVRYRGDAKLPEDAP